MAGRSEELGMSEERLARIRPAMESLIGKRQFFGGEILVACHGEILLHEAVGYRDWGD